MNTRRVMAYSPHICHWVSVMAIDIGQKDETRIPADLHPAIAEDAWLAAALTSHEQIVNFLRTTGPSTYSQVVKALDIPASTTCSILKRRPDTFEIVDYTSHRYGRVAVWGLK